MASKSLLMCALLLVAPCEGFGPSLFGGQADLFPDHGQLSQTIAASALVNQHETPCKLSGAVDECCNCTYSSVDEMNQGIVFPVVEKLVKTAFFRYFKVNIHCDCPLWPDDSMCAMKACSVCECDADEIPKQWLSAEMKGRCAAPPPSAQVNISDLGSSCGKSSCQTDEQSKVNTEVEPSMQAALLNLKGWRGYNNPWMSEGDEGEEYNYINLLENPERYTGYQGEHAHRIWSGIYSQSCFAEDLKLECEESRIFYRLISGMHTSISAHIAGKYLLSETWDGQEIWGPNYDEFRQRLGHAGVAYRVENLYFAYLFVLRAVMKAGPLLDKFSYQTGSAAEDNTTAELVHKLINEQKLWQACPMPFDEGRLWKGSNADNLRSLVQDSFRNITILMDCVGCEKCKLWGKLQTLGIATALKILFSSTDCDGIVPIHGGPSSKLVLERNEVIALFNLLERFSTSIEIYREMSSHINRGQATVPHNDTIS